MATAAPTSPDVGAPVPSSPAPAATAAAAAPVTPSVATDVAQNSRQATEKLRLLRDRQAFEADRTSFQKEREAHAQLAQALKSKDPVKILQAGGLSSDEVAKFLVNGAGAPENAKLSELEGRLSAQQQALDAVTKAETERAAGTRKAAEQEARDEALAIFADAKDTLPWVNALGQGDAVIAEMRATYKKTGEMPDIEASAKAVEARLAAQMPAYIEKLVAFPAVKELLQAALAKVAKPETSVVPALPAMAEAKDEVKLETKPSGWKVQRRTLSNDMNAVGAPARPKTESEIWRELQSKFKATP